MNETALKDRLKVIAKEKGSTFNEVWKQFLLERFLARLSHSDHQEKFIFKGGLLLAQYLIIGRETTDADFLMTKMKSEAGVIETALKEVAAINLEDAFAYSMSDVVELTQPHMEYPGFRVSMDVNFGKMKDKIQIDIGVGDLVNAVEDNFQPFEYRGKPIFEGEISLLMYPVETIFAEKLETIISKGVVNSRMKDYHDVILMSREPGLLDIQKLKTSITSTFGNRGTTLVLPIQFGAAGIASMQTLWGRHLNGLGEFKKKLNLPEQMTDVLHEVNTWLSANGVP
jgi:predicted nucleotidyltransferase component of viral defense system